jgi:hypothetical protein
MVLVLDAGDVPGEDETDIPRMSFPHMVEATR